jgi:hypothetical protein
MNPTKTGGELWCAPEGTAVNFCSTCGTPFTVSYQVRRHFNSHVVPFDFTDLDKKKKKNVTEDLLPRTNLIQTVLG